MAALGSYLGGMDSRDLDSNADFFNEVMAGTFGADLPLFPSVPPPTSTNNVITTTAAGAPLSLQPGGFPGGLLTQQEVGISGRMMGYEGLYGGFGGWGGETGHNFVDGMKAETGEVSADASSGGKRSEEEVSKSKTEQLLKRQAAVQAKNRKAQKRFREKQKAKMANLEEEVATLKTQLDEMKMQNDTLSSQNGLLSKVLEFKDDQMAVLQEGAKVLCRGRNEDAIDLAKWKSLLGFEDQADTQESKLPVSQFQNLNEEQLKRVWKGYVQRLSQLLVSVGQDPEDKQKSDELAVVMREIGELMYKAANLCPMSMRSFVTSSCEGELPNDRSKLHRRWKEVLELMELSPEQESLAMSLRGTFVAKMRDIYEERGTLNRAFQACAARQVDLGSTPDTCKASSDMQGIMEGLKNSLHRETQYHTDFIGAFLKDILTQEQRAKTYVHSYPLYPDVLSLSSLIAQKYDAEMK